MEKKGGNNESIRKAKLMNFKEDYDGNEMLKVGFTG